MGKTITTKYRVEYRDNDFKSVRESRWTGSCGHDCHTMAWSGRATLERLEKWRRDYNKSFEKGGANEYLSKAVGFIVRVGDCQIVEQRTGRVVCKFSAPLFEEVYWS